MTQETLPSRWAGRTVAIIVAGCVLVASGCAERPALSRSNAPPQGQRTTANPLQENYVHMVDNALLADRSMSSVHFVPQSAELNALGVRRLLRYASILEVYGGTLCYDGTEPDPDLRENRIEQIEAFLVASGLEPDQFDVEQGFAGGSDMSAMEATLIRAATRGPGDVEVTGEAAGGGGGGK